MRLTLHWLICLLTLSFAQVGQAQTDITIGIGSTGNGNQAYPTPFQDWYEGSRAQFLYRASELTAQGMGTGVITAIKFNVTALNAFNGNLHSYTVKIGHTNATTLGTASTDWEPTTATVFGPVDFTPVLGVNTITFSAPFMWNGTSNLVIEICDGLAGNETDGLTHYTENLTVPYTTGLAFNGSHTIAADNAGNLCSSTAAGAAITTAPTSRPNITFVWTPATACTGIPNAGTATSTITNILCPNAQFTLGLSGQSVASGLTYQWQVSGDNVNYTNIAGASSFSYTTTHNQPIRYYRAVVKCTNSGDSAFSNSVAVTNNSGPTYAALPFTESFEATWMNTCNPREIPNNSWRNNPGTGNNSWRRNDDGAGAAWTTPATGAYLPAGSVGSFSARFHTTSVPVNQTGSLDVYINGATAGSAKRLRFDYINTSGTDSVTILLSTNGGTSFVRLDSVRTSSSWRTKTVIFNSNSATTVIRFLARSDDGTSDIGIDNVRITEFEDCSGTPVGGTASTSANNVCVTTQFTLSVTGATDANGLIYQWEKADSITGGWAAWTAITGADDITYTTTQGVTTKYRLKVTCTLNGNIGYSSEIIVQSPPILNGNYIINKNQPTNQLWPVTNVFKSFNDAKTAMSCGIAGNVLFTVASGTGPYTEQLLFTTPIAGASPTRKVTFDGNGEVLTFAGTASERAVIKINNVDHIRFQNLVINNTATAQGFGIQLMNNADSIVISNCTINLSTTSNAVGFAGIVINSSATDAIGTGNTLCDSNTVIGNRIIGGYYGITIAGTLTGASGDNIIAKNDIRDFYNYGIYMIGTYNTLVDSNTLSRPTRTAVGNFVGIHSTGNNLNNTITRNRIHNPFSGALSSTATFTGINFENSVTEAALPITITNNLIHGVNGNGVQTGINNANSSNLFFFHNTISLDTVFNTGTVTTRGYNQTTVGDVFFYNNIVNITRAGSGQKHAIYLGSASSFFESDYNDLFVSGTNSHIGFLTSNRTTFANWKATGKDANSFNYPPAFKDPQIGNMAPQSAGIDNQGMGGLGVLVDYYGVVRGTSTTPPTPPGPDPGAIEFVPPPCTAPPIAGTTVVSSTDICWGRDILLNLNGNTLGLTQTFQWQYAYPTAPNTWMNLGTAGAYPDTTIKADTTIIIRAVVTCAGQTDTSNEVTINVTAPLYQGTYTINANNPTNYTQGSGNFNSFNDAKNAMKCGITGAIVFDVQQGLPTNANAHVEQLKLGYIFNMSTTNTVTFRGNGNTIKFNSTNSNERAVIKLDSARFFIFDSLVIDASGGSFGYGVQLMNDADTNVFRNNTIISSPTSNSTSNFAGIVLNYSNNAAPTTTGNALTDYNTFDKNTIRGGAYGIIAVGGTGASATSQLITDNKFTNNIIEDFFSHGVYLSGTDNTLIQGNTFRRPTRTNAASIVYGIQLTGSVSNGSVISKNRFTSMFDAVPTSGTQFWGIHHNNVDAAATENVVVNNIFYRLNGGGIQYALYNTGSNNVRYYHNTISLDHNDGVTVNGATAGFYQTTAATGIVFKNNIITIKRNSTGIKHAINLQTTGASGSEVSLSNNNYFVQGNNAHVGFYGSNRTTMAAWETASGDQNSLNLDPLYADTLSGNLKPQLFPLDNKGTSVGVADDILGLTRPAFGGSVPDIGAFEFNPPACANPLIAGTASVTPASGLCLEQPIKLNITGHSPLGVVTFQWQYASSANGPWVNLTTERFSPEFDTVSTVQNYYRAVVRCGGTTVYTDTIMLGLNVILPAGTYTIDSTMATVFPPVNGSNFRNFTDAVNAMRCGIAGKVTFNVKPAPGGVYREQIRMGYIAGTSEINTVTFQSFNGDPASAILTYDSSTAAANYTLRIDSADHIIFKNMTINATNYATYNASYGRAIDIVGVSHADSFLNCVINVPASVSTSNTITGIFSNQFKGHDIVIKGNTINGGSSGIYFAGTSTTNLADDIYIDSNTVNNFGYYGIYTSFTNGLMLRKNTVNMTAPLVTNSYGIWTNYCDSGMVVGNNNVNIINTTGGNVYGISLNLSRSVESNPILINGNKVIASGTNTGAQYGIYVKFDQAAVQSAHTVVNNVISLNTTHTTSYGLYNNNSANGRYYNNSVNNTSNGTNLSYAAYFANSTAMGIDVKNNIFAHKGAGRALFVTNTDGFSSDYNMLYKGTGTVLAARQNPSTGGLTFANLLAWRSNAYLDFYSISEINPAWISDTDLTPDVTKDSVWAIHGRGTQIKTPTYTNNFDINGNYRADTIINGVPDLGAYEFAAPNIPPPIALPVLTTVPASNTNQAFMFGTDTVMKIEWGVKVPSSINVRRYSGVKAPGLTPAQVNSSMYFYVDIDVPNAIDSSYDMKSFILNYIDPWQGHLADLNTGGLGRNTRGNSWVGVPLSIVDQVDKVIRTSNDLDRFLDKFTGLYNPYAPPVLADEDSSNTGKRFWVAYPINQLNGSQEMVIYMSAVNQNANVQVRINGTNCFWNYFVPAGTVKATPYLPKAAGSPCNAFIQAPGLSDRGISITSDVPIDVYTHTIGNTSSGGTTLLPVGVWAYEYRILGMSPNGYNNAYSFFYVIADKNNTKVEIVPTVPVQNPGMAVGVPHYVTLNKGEFFQVIAVGNTNDLTGSSVKSIPNSDSICHAIAVFSGVSRASLTLGGSGSGGDFAMQQNFPYSAWGKMFLTAPQSTNTAANRHALTMYRVMFRDTDTEVRKNGVLLTNPTSQGYYQFVDSTANYIEATKPIMVAKYFGGGAPGNLGDPEMIYISPIEQGIRNIGFYRNTEENIGVNYLTLIIPSGGTALSSLVLKDGINSTGWTYTYNHPNRPGYRVMVKRWDPSAKQQTTVKSDSAFTAITYGLGSVESYGYNAGTLVRTLRPVVRPKPPLPPGAPTVPTYVCAKTPVLFNIFIPLKPDTLIWQFSKVPGLSLNVDSIQYHPVAIDSFEKNGVWYYGFTVNQPFIFDQPGIITVPVTFTHPDIESCDKRYQSNTMVQVVPAAEPDFNIAFSGCLGDTAKFHAINTTITGQNVYEYTWNLMDGDSSHAKDTMKLFTTPGDKFVKLHVWTYDGCYGDTVKKVTVNPLPTVDVVNDSVRICYNQQAIIDVLNPVANDTYNWYNSATGGTVLHTGTSLTLANVTADTTFYIEAVSAAGCISSGRTKASVFVSQIPTINTVDPTPKVCQGSTVMLEVLNPQTGTTYNWYGPGNQNLFIQSGGTYTVPASATGTVGTITYYAEAVTAAGCTSLVKSPIVVTVNALPTVTVPTTPYTICPGQSQMMSVVNPEPGVVYTWFSTVTGGTPLASGNSYTVTPATNTTYYVEATSPAGCVSPNRAPITVNISALPTVSVAQTTIDICAGGTATLAVQNPQTGISYNWTGPMTGTGSTFPVTAAGTYSVTATNVLGCVSQAAQVTVNAFPILAAPVVVCPQNILPTSITYSWTAVAGATGYEVSTTPTGPWTAITGTTHTLNSLLPSTNYSLWVRSTGTLPCQTSPADSAMCSTLDDEFFIPNSFTPNADGKNDEWRVYGAVINDVRMMVFNQWGQKVFEVNGTVDQAKWNGTYKGERLPVGVYVYVLKLNLKDGTTIDRKGLINLVR